MTKAKKGGLVRSTGGSVARTSAGSNPAPSIKQKFAEKILKVLERLVVIEEKWHKLQDTEPFQAAFFWAFCILLLVWMFWVTFN